MFSMDTVDFIRKQFIRNLVLVQWYRSFKKRGKSKNPRGIQKFGQKWAGGAALVVKLNTLYFVKYYIEMQ